MGCVACGHLEKSASPGSEYICGICVSLLCSKDASGVREVVDQLYLKGKTHEAEFIEKFAFGKIHSIRPTTTKLKVRVCAYKGLKPRFQ